MLAFAFGISIFSSCLWLFYIISYISDKLGEMSFSSVGMTDFTIYIALIIFPVFLIWTIFGFISQFIANRVFNKNLYELFMQMKKSQDYVDLMARVLIESKQQLKDGFVLNNIDIFIADLNEILSEILYRCKIISKEQIEDLWSKVQNGGKWSFAKVLIEVSQTQPVFGTRIIDKANHDVVLSGSVLEFCGRYLSLVELLEKYDRDKMFINIIETGVMGKAFSVLLPIAEKIKQHRELKPSVETLGSYPAQAVEETKAPLMSKINIFKKKEEIFIEKSEPSIVEKDPFSVALERSFGEEKTEVQEPKFEAVFEVSSIKDEPRFDISSTQQTIDELQQDWEETKISSPAKEPEKDEPTLAYPFGGWTNEDNYK